MGAWRRLGDAFDLVATGFGHWMSNPLAFLAVFTIVLVLTVAGFLLGFVGTWLSTMHVAGPVITLLLVFLLQHGQAKNTRALQLKLDELISTQSGARQSTIKSEQGPTNALRAMERQHTQGRRGGPGNVQDTRAGAQRRSKDDANGSQRGKAGRDPRDRRRRAEPRARLRAPRVRGQGR